MSLIELAFALAWIVVVIFGGLFFVEWAEKHCQSFTMELFAQFGMPALLWCGMLLLYELLRQKGILA